MENRKELSVLQNPLTYMRVNRWQQGLQAILKIDRSLVELISVHASSELGEFSISF